MILIVNGTTLSCISPDDARYSENVCIETRTILY